MSKARPSLPAWGRWILRLLLSEEDYVFFSGDLEESRLEEIKRGNRLIAPLRLHVWLVTIITPLLMSKLRWAVVLMANDLKIASRNIKKHKISSVINITGLAVGLAFFILLISYVRDEWSYDRFHKKSPWIYLTTVSMLNNPPGAASAPILAQTLQAEFPEINTAVRYWLTSQAIKSDAVIQNQDVALADPAFFSLFDFPLRSGSLDQALDAPNRVVLTVDSASLFFGPADPVGKVLSINLGNQPRDFVVVGILEKLPRNSSIQFDLLISFEHLSQIFGQEFTGGLVDTPFFHATFLELNKTSSPQDLESKFPAYVQKYYGENFRKYEVDPVALSLGLYRFSDFHLGSMNGASLVGRSRPFYSWILFGIALVVLLLACSNYMNLSLGLSSLRCKEIGVRKVVGASKTHLLRQFLNESLLLSFLAIAMGTFLAVLAFPQFNQYTGKSLSIDFLLNIPSLSILAGLLLLTGFISGSYPAVLLSSLKIPNIFSGKLRLGGKNVLTRSLLIFQFMLTIFLVAGSLIMLRQIDYLTSEDLGYDYQNLVAIPTYSFWNYDESGDRALAAFQRSSEKHSEILAVAGTNGYGNPMGWSNRTDYKFQDSQISVFHKRVDYGFLNAVKIPLIKGRNFTREYSSDIEDAVIVNETFVRRFGLEKPIGKNFAEFAKDSGPPAAEYSPIIIGVVRDFHFNSLHEEIGPLLLNMKPKDPLMYILIRIKSGNPASALAALRETWMKTNPDKPFNPIFMDDAIKAQYNKERNWSGIIRVSSVVSILIAAMGLFGLTSLTVSRRTKEIGIRKVLGADISSILSLLSREFVYLILLANMAAWPLIYFAAAKWLQSFAYQSSIAFWIFPLAGLIILYLDLMMVCIQAVRAALKNPVNTLRYE